MTHGQNSAKKNAVDSVSEYRVTEGRELLALIREAFAFRDTVFILVEAFRIPVEIVNFDDDDTRELNKLRSLELILPSQDITRSVLELKSITIEIISKRFKLTFVGTLSGGTVDSVCIQIPLCGNLSNVRKSDRISVKEDHLADGVILTDQSVFSCLLKFVDITSGALGAHIYTDAPLESQTNPILQTQFNGNDLTFSGSAKLIRVQRRNSGSSHFEYLVGLEPIFQKFQSPIERASRFILNTALHCVVLSSNTPVQFDVTDMSASGFRASKCAPALTWLTEGIKIKELSTGLYFTVARLEATGALGARLSSRNPEDKIKWNNFALPMIRAGSVSASSHDARALVNVFLEAGGSIADNLAYKRHAVTQITTQSVLTDRSNVLLRWVNVSPDGVIRGHHSSYRIGLNSWFTGDIVGGQSKHKKIDSDFIGMNFRTFREFLLSIHEPQLVFGSWKFGHPYWQNWREFLVNGNHTVFLEKYDHISRSHLLSSVERRIYERLTAQSICNFGSNGIAQIIGELDRSPLKRLLGALDITSSGVFYNGLESIYTNGQMSGFRREVYITNFDKLRSLVVLSQLPGGVSINGVFDTIFVMPLEPVSTHISRTEKINFLSSLLAMAISKGFRISSIRSFINPEDTIGTLTELVVLRTEGMEFFCK